MSPFRNHITAVVLYADIWAELAKAAGAPFDKDAFLEECWQDMREQCDLKMDKDMAETYFKLEAEQARQRLAAIAGTYKA